MTIIVLYTVFYIWFIFIDLVPIYKNKQNKVLWIYSVMMAFSYVILMLIGLKVKIPSPTPLLEKIISSIFGL